MADRGTYLGKRRVTGIQGFQRIGEYLSEPIRLDKLPIRFSGSGEARRHPDAFFFEAANHLAERGIFPADASDIATTDVLVPENLRRLRLHGTLPNLSAGCAPQPEIRLEGADQIEPILHQPRHQETSAYGLLCVLPQP